MPASSPPPCPHSAFVSTFLRPPDALLEAAVAKVLQRGAALLSGEALDQEPAVEEGEKGTASVASGRASAPPLPASSALHASWPPAGSPRPPPYPPPDAQPPPSPLQPTPPAVCRLPPPADAAATAAHPDASCGLAADERAPLTASLWGWAAGGGAAAWEADVAVVREVRRAGRLDRGG